MSRRSSFYYYRKGFTIVELLIVIVVIAILAAITVIGYNGITNRAKDSAAASAVSQASKKVLAYATLNSEQLPADLATAGLTNDANTTYQYTRNTAVTPNLYCITATTNNTSSHIASNGQPTEGPCPGHTGTAPTVAANGEPCPTGYIVVPGSSLYNTQAFCVMKYEAKIQGVSSGAQTYSSSYVAESRADGTPWVGISQTDAIAEAAALGSGSHLITENEWLTIAQNVLSVDSNWSGGTVGSGAIYAGHNDNSPGSANGAANDSLMCFSTVIVGTPSDCSTSGAQRRIHTLTNGEVIWDIAGNVWEWTQGTTEGGNQPGASGLNWRNWNALSVQGNLSPNPSPLYANPLAASWTHTQSIGRLYSDSSETGLRALPRGGNWSDTTYAGIYALTTIRLPGTAYSIVGFRVAR